MKNILQGRPFKHPLHPLLVHFPIGLFALSFLLDLGSFLAPQNSGLLRGAFWCMLLGIVTSLVAAVAGFADYVDIRRDRPGRSVATTHMILNLLMVGVYAVNAGMRLPLPETGKTPAGPLILSLVGIALLSISGYLGGHMIYADGIAVGRHRRQTPLPQRTIRLSSTAVNQKTDPGADSVYVPVLETGQLRDKESVRVEIDRQAIVLMKLEGQFYAFQDFCTHRFGPLSEGSIHGDDIECPWHRSCFDVRTGKVIRGPAKADLKAFPTQVRNGKVEVGIPRAQS